MKVYYAREPLPSTVANSIFLMGPTPRHESVPSWRPEALKLLAERAFTGNILVPEDRPDDDGKTRFRGNYDDQVEWEREALAKSTVIMAYVPRHLESMPGFTTNVEWGMLWDSGRITFGAPAEAPKNEYLRWYASKDDVPVADTLGGAVNNTLELLNDFKRLNSTCVFCDIIHNDPHNQIESRTLHSAIFTPLNPAVDGHKLVVPTRHVMSAVERPGVAAESFKDAASYVKERGYDANIITSIGKHATQTVFHLHFHVIPRHEGDGVVLPWSYQNTQE